MQGGNLDIDVMVYSPTNQTIYKEIRSRENKFQFTTTVSATDLEFMYTIGLFIFLFVFASRKSEEKKTIDYLYFFSWCDRFGKLKEQGAHVICFSNQFSTITHKNVFLSLKFGEDKPISMITYPDNYVAGPLTFMESASAEIYDNLEEISEYQTHFRLVWNIAHFCIQFHMLFHISGSVNIILVVFFFNCFSKKHRVDCLQKRLMNVFCGGRSCKHS